MFVSYRFLARTMTVYPAVRCMICWIFIDLSMTMFAVHSCPNLDDVNKDNLRYLKGGSDPMLSVPMGFPIEVRLSHCPWNSARFR